MCSHHHLCCSFLQHGYENFQKGDHSNLNLVRKWDRPFCSYFLDWARSWPHVWNLDEQHWFELVSQILWYNTFPTVVLYRIDLGQFNRHSSSSMHTSPHKFQCWAQHSSEQISNCKWSVPLYKPKNDSSRQIFIRYFYSTIPINKKMQYNRSHLCQWCSFQYSTSNRGKDIVTSADHKIHSKSK